MEDKMPLSKEDPALIGAVEQLGDMMRADGADLLLSSVDGDVVRLALLLDKVPCLDCVLPREMLATIAADRISSATGISVTVEISDPRDAPGFAATPTHDGEAIAR
jgi:hypothetical protein